MVLIDSLLVGGLRFVLVSVGLEADHERDPARLQEKRKADRDAAGADGDARMRRTRDMDVSAEGDGDA
jgi:hypothetical protein